MKNIPTLLLALFSITPGLYAMNDQFKSEQEIKAIHSIEEADEADTDYYTVLDLRPANMRYKQWLEADQNPENIAKKLARAAATQQTDEILARSCGISLARAASLPTEIQELIWSFATNRKKRFVINHMEKLLPAMLSYGDYLSHKNIFHDLIKCAQQEDAQRRRNMQQQNVTPRLYLEGTKHVQLYRGHLGACIAEHADHLPQSILASTRAPLDSRPGEFDIMYYTNGSSIIKVDDATRTTVENLSDEHLNFLVHLYTARQQALEERDSSTLTLTPEELAVFYSLPKDIKRAVKANYSITNAQTTCDRITMAAFYCALIPLAALTLKIVVPLMLGGKC
jgi:hypothetical protein